MARDFGAADAAICRHWEQGGRGALALADKVMGICDSASPTPSFLYDLDESVESKIDAVARSVHRSNGVEWSAHAKENLEKIKRLGFSDLPLCIARSPWAWRLKDPASGEWGPESPQESAPMVIRDIQLAAGAGILIPEVDKTVTMP